MSKFAIKVENLSKKYRLGEYGIGTFVDDLHRRIKKITGGSNLEELIQSNDRTTASESNFVWVLKELNFEIQPGEIVAIIGKNGAGKSTLLKILSKITGPTDGTITINGRVASLLEVGTGMHPDLTGRENIFLNGAILGMTKAEIKLKLDDIIEFAGIKKYIDTPIKRYSSGMTVRLGFAVAAFLEPEILIVDEVLAVGDAEFQQRAIGKMKSVSQNDKRTVLFVSHNMSSVLDLCKRGILLKNGHIDKIGPIHEIVSAYLQNNNKEIDASRDLSKITDREGNGSIQFIRYNILDDEGNELANVLSGQDITFELSFKVNVSRDYPILHFSVAITDEMNRNLIHLSTTESMGSELKIDENIQSGKVRCTIKNLPLPADNYYLSFFVSDLVEVFDRIDGGGLLTTEDGNFFSNGKKKEVTFTRFLSKSEWELVPISNQIM
jgi:lipopolysaccharide transport system ATP-binding protein